VPTARARESPRTDAVIVHPEPQIKKGNREAVGDGGMGEIKHGDET
jgi:hypothetical protein